MLFRIRHAAGPNTIFAPGLFDDAIGQEIPVEVAEGVVLTGVIRDAAVIDCGTAVFLEIELPDPPPPVGLADGVLERFRRQSNSDLP